MTQPLNVSRKFRQFVNNSQWNADEQKHIVPLAKLCEFGTHFLLPEGGVLFVDHALKALSTDDDLRLPYPITILEFLVKNDTGNRKVMILCYESSEQPKPLRISIYSWSFDGEFWNWLTPAYLNVNGALNEHSKDGRGVFVNEFGDFAGRKTTPNASKSSVRVLLQFLNVIACSNVQSEIIKGREKSAKHCKDALPFDDYRILTVGNEREQTTGSGHGGSHRSPREHLRRGHIVRPEGRRPFWRNATVVNAGVGGKVHKDYRVAA